MKGTARIKILSIIFILLSIAAYFALQEKFSTDTINKDKEGIAIEDTASIDKIIIEKNGQIVLTRTQGGWMVNNKYQGRQYVINMLLFGLNQLQLKRQASEESKKKILDMLIKEGEKVTVFYGEEQKKVMTFLTNENDINTTYFLAENSQIPEIAYVPGVPGDINNLFRFKENDWRSRRLFASSARAIQDIKVTYPRDAEGSFNIFYKDGDFHVKDLDKSDTAKLYEYIDYFGNIPVSSYLTISKDSIDQVLKSASLYASIELIDINPEKNVMLEVYKYSEPKKDYLGIIGKSGETIILNKDLFDRLLVKKSYFKGR